MVMDLSLALFSSRQILYHCWRWASWYFRNMMKDHGSHVHTWLVRHWSNRISKGCYIWKTRVLSSTWFIYILQYAGAGIKPWYLLFESNRMCLPVDNCPAWYTIMNKLKLAYFYKGADLALWQAGRLPWLGHWSFFFLYRSIGLLC